MNARTLVPAACLSCSASLLANGGGYLQGVKSTGPFRPVNVDAVEMTSEKLDIELKQDAAVISIDYQLYNPGKAVKVEMGFPCAVTVKPDYDEVGKPLPLKSLPQLEGFVLTADGKKIESQLTQDHAILSPGEAENHVGGSIITAWQVVKLPFAAGQTRAVSVRYRNPYYRSVSYVSDDSYKSAPSISYLFSAAALWKGVIKTGEVTVRATGIKPEDVTLSHPDRFERSGNQWTWVFNDFEPTMQDDLTLVVGEAEFSQHQSDGDRLLGNYVVRGRSYNHDELRKNGKWFFLSAQFTATASSSLKSEAGLSYGPENINGDREDAWAEGAEGDGIGEWVTLTMDKPVKATRLLIHNGYRKDDLFLKNNRVKRLGVSVNGGASFSAELPDGQESECWIDLPQDGEPLETVRLTIEEVYRGAQFRDTCITAIEVEVPLSKAPVIRPAR